MRRQHVIAAATAFLAFMQITSPSNLRAQDSDDPDAVKIVRIKMTANELKAEGITVNANGSKAFSNSCAEAGNPGLSVSDEIVAHFRSRGFSLTSLCLGLSSVVNFDPETGRQIPIAFVVDTSEDDLNRELPLNLPDCFREAAPFQDCVSNYHFFEGIPLDESERDSDHEAGDRIDVEYRRFIATHHPRGVFYDFYGNDRDAQGELLYHGIDVQKLEDVGGSAIGWAVAAGDLKRGYGYTLSCCEGPDTAPEDVDLKTYRKDREAWKTWNE